MSYIGVKPTIGNFQICDAISVVNGQAAYTMQVGSVNVIPQSANHMIVSLNGTIQKPNSSFTVANSVITFSSNLATGDVIDFIQILGDVLDLGVPSDSTVTTAKLASTSVTAAKLNNDIISGSTELASEPADTDEFLVSDAGTLKRIDYSLIKGGGITQADQWRVTANTTNDGSNEVTSNWERCDNSFSPVGTGVSESSGVFSFPTTGIYHVSWHTMALGNGGARAYMGNDIRYTTNNSSYTNLASAYGNAYADQAYGGGTSFFMFDVTNVSTHKLKFRYISSGSAIFEGHTDRNWQVATFIRLGDT